MDEYLMHELERDLRQAQRTIARMQGAMRTAANYRAQGTPDEDELSILSRTVEGIQAALLKGAEEAFRPNGRGKKHR